MITRVGFTGTRRGMTAPQSARFDEIIRRVSCAVIHHGDCIGADEQGNWIAVHYGIFVEIHPPTDSSARAFCLGDHPDGYHRPLPYLERNHAIVDATDILIAAPHGPEEQRSGTWSTVRYARRQGKPIIIIWPDGSETREGER